MQVMNAKTKVVSLKLTEEERHALEELVRTGAFQSVSAAIREGLQLLFAKYAINPSHVERMAAARRIRPGRISYKVRKPRDNILVP